MVGKRNTVPFLRRIEIAKRAVKNYYFGEKYTPSAADTDDLTYVFGDDTRQLETLLPEDVATILSVATLSGSYHSEKKTAIDAAKRLRHRLDLLQSERDMSVTLGLGPKPFCAITDAETIRLRSFLDSDWAKVGSIANVVFSEEEAEKRRQRLHHKLETTGVTSRCKCCRYEKHAPRHAARKTCRNMTTSGDRFWEDDDLKVDDDVAAEFAHDSCAGDEEKGVDNNAIHDDQI
ncbi:hypothetical protein SDRG_12164 [Saprolegnia diclina VS20]|uniref:Uncharacterized protein n=1 Tax=Saprolegnia diclina (strain VS20) TaxID=1156394 RepID=T0Q9F3_SAPDV|nr:hypothetical protein SDRG_12164 [Saprolegnia diclina VS20]EQC30105.1 hypothetical protein SDRG_12164 [Saprolegnia diclina VS20]|eukprot:XP_008616448.1 hypothetical protein SDRG_12164 [Saprolegnia diclina VS20]